MMAVSLVLDCFDAVQNDAPDPAIDDAYQKGFSDGLESKMAEIDSNNAVLEDNLIAAISDLSFGYVEARAHLTEGLRGLFNAITDRLVPEMIEATFAAQLADQILAQCEAAFARPITLFLHPEKIALVEPFVTAATGLTITCLADETLTQTEARWGSGPDEMTYDLAPLAATIRTALDAVLYENIKVENHG